MGIPLVAALRAAAVSSALVLSAFVALPAGAAVDPGLAAPTGVTTKGVPLGVEVRWQAPESAYGVTGYRVTTAAGSEDVPADRTSWIVDTARPGDAVSAAVAALYGEDESTATPAPAASSTAPGGLVSVLPSAAKLLDTTTGTGIAKGLLADDVTKTVQVAGKAGVPASGVGAAWVSMTVSGATKSTSASLWTYGRTQPAAATVSTVAGRTVTRAALVALDSKGRLQLRHTSGDAHVRVDVRGWASQSAGPGSDGMLRAVAPASVLDTSIGAGKYTEVAVLGKGGVPTTGVRAVVLTVMGVSATATSAVSVSSAGKASTARAVTARKGATTSAEIVVRPGGDGKVRVTNSAGTTRVKVVVRGWVSSGAVAPDDATWVRTQAPASAGEPSVAAGKTSLVPIAGRAGVPAMTSTTPPTAVALALRVTGSTSASAVPVSLGGSSREVSGEAGAPATGLLWAPVDSVGRVSLRNLSTSAAAKVRVDVVGWTMGGTLLAPDAKVLTGTAAAAYTDAGPYGLTLAAGSAAPAVGTVLAAGPTAKAPYGFLRRVTGVSGDAATGWAVETRQAGLSEVVRRGSASTTRALGEPVETLVEPDPSAAASRAMRTAAAAKATAPAGIGAGTIISFDQSIGGDTASARITGSAGISARANVSIDAGWTGVDARATLSAEEHIDASVTAAAEAAWARTFTLGRYRFPTFVVQVGPVPVTITPVVELSVSANGSVAGSFTQTFHQEASGEIGFSYTDGDFHAIKEFSHPTPTLETNATFNAGADASLEAKAELLFYGTGSLHASLIASGSVSYSAPGCFVVTEAKLTGRVGVGLDLPLMPAKSEDFDFTVKEFDIPDIQVPGATACSWTGTLTFDNDWKSTGQWRNYVDNTLGGHAEVAGRSGLTMQFVIEDGKSLGYWRAQGTNHSAIESPYGNNCHRSEADGSVSPTAVPEENWHPSSAFIGDRWYFNDPAAYPGTTTVSYRQSDCGEAPSAQAQFYPGTDIGVALILEELAKVAPVNGVLHTTVSLPAATVCGQHQCQPPAHPYPELGQPTDLDPSTVQITGTMSVTAQMTNLHDANSDGIPD